METSTANTKVKKPAKRNTEARREQNRLASRNYREKRKQKLALLNQILDGDNGQLDQEPALSGTETDTINNALPNTGVSQDPIELISAPSNEVSIGNAWGDLPDNSTVTFGPTPYLDRMKTPDFTSGQDFGLENLLSWDPSVSTQALFEGLLPSSEQNASLQGPTVPNNPFFDVLKGVDSLSFHQKRALLRHLQKQTQDSDPTFQIRAPPISPPSHLSPEQLKAMCHTGLQIEAQQFAHDLYRAASRVGPAPMPSQYVLQSGFFGALLANCYAIGMGSVDALLVEDSWSVFSLGPEIGYHPSQLPVARARFQDMTPDLRPVDIQLTFAHHPYLDVLPFRTFRENALKALDRTPPLLDEDELCRDLLAGGLLCWGASQKALGLDAAVPWDSRSWEPKVWFLKKYKHIVGGRDDEMWKRTQWWHRVRGERIQEIE